MVHAKLGQDETYFGDTITTSIGRIPIRAFKRYYYDAVYDYATRKKPEAITMARPFSHQGTFAASINKVGLGWSGDFKGNYDGLKLQISNIYTSAKAGYGALACEVGGFYKDRSTKAQLIRYAQFGSMTASMINGGQNGAFTNHLPWYHDKETTDIYRFYVTLHYQLSPYNFSTIVDAHINGGSLLKDVSLEQESHKLGNDIFFKAITSDTAEVSFNLPSEGNWIDFWTDKKFKGGSKIIQEYSLKQAPIFIKSGAIIPLEINNNITGIGNESFEGKIVILIYPDGVSHYLFHKPLGEGIEYEDIDIRYKNGRITIKSTMENSFIFLVKIDTKPKKVNGCNKWEYDKNTKQLKLEQEGSNFEIEFS
jgi:alpha-glucosidase (family GH31 glycosyl hydrolase)